MGEVGCGERNFPTSFLQKLFPFAKPLQDFSGLSIYIKEIVTGNQLINMKSKARVKPVT